MTKRSYEIEHVLMTASAVGSVWTYAIDLARGLAAQGVRTTLATTGVSPTLSQREEARGIPGLELHACTFRQERTASPTEEVDEAGRWLLALADRTRPDVVHLNSYALASLPWNIPTLVVGHGDEISRQRAARPDVETSPEWDAYRRLVRRGLCSAGMVVTSTAAAMNDLEREYGSVVEGRVIPTGRSTSGFRIERKRRMIIAASRCWDEVKNLAALQRSATEIEWPIYVAGDLPQNRQPRTQGIHFLGRLGAAALSSWYSRAEICVVPSKYDPSGATALEAALSGCSLLLADIPSLREQWDGAAMFASPDDPCAFAAALRDLTENDGLRQDLSEAAKERAKVFNLTAMVCGYLFAYQDLKQTAQLDLTVLSHPGIRML